jgi:hypothetical protein
LSRRVFDPLMSAISSALFDLPLDDLHPELGELFPQGSGAGEWDGALGRALSAAKKASGLALVRQSFLGFALSAPPQAAEEAAQALFSPRWSQRLRELSGAEASARVRARQKRSSRGLPALSGPQGATNASATQADKKETPEAFFARKEAGFLLQALGAAISRDSQELFDRFVRVAPLAREALDLASLPRFDRAARHPPNAMMAVAGSARHPLALALVSERRDFWLDRLLSLWGAPTGTMARAALLWAASAGGAAMLSLMDRLAPREIEDCAVFIQMPSSDSDAGSGSAEWSVVVSPAGLLASGLSKAKANAAGEPVGASERDFRDVGRALRRLREAGGDLALVSEASQPARQMSIHALRSPFCSLLSLGDAAIPALEELLADGVVLPEARPGDGGAAWLFDLGRTLSLNLAMSARGRLYPPMERLPAFLASFGADPSASEKVDGQSRAEEPVLLTAARLGHLSFAQGLVAAGADLRAKVEFSIVDCLDAWFPLAALPVSVDKPAMLAFFAPQWLAVAALSQEWMIRKGARPGATPERAAALMAALAERGVDFTAPIAAGDFGVVSREPAAGALRESAPLQFPSVGEALPIARPLFDQQALRTTLAAAEAQRAAEGGSPANDTAPDAAKTAPFRRL